MKGVKMTFSAFVKILKYFYNKSTTNGMFVLELIDESLEDVSKEDEKQKGQRCCLFCNEE